jgi:TonB family protein
VIDTVLNLLFRCPHKRITRPITPASRAGLPNKTYVVCLDCGKQFSYDLKEMRIGKPVAFSPTAGVSILPETLAAPFLDIARHCLSRDPARRWTVTDIAARLRQTSPAPQGQTIARPPETFAKWRYIVPMVAVGLALAAMLAGPRLFKRHPEAQRAPIAFELPRVQPKSEPKPVTPETGQSTQRTSDEKQRSPGAAPAPTPLRSEAGAKIPTGGLVPGEVVHQGLPDVPRKARNTIRGKVRVSVRVRVDPSGSVVGTTLDSPGPSRYFAERALQAARLWKFAPAKINGRNVSSEWMLRFEFARTATRVLCWPTS